MIAGFFQCEEALVLGFLHSLNPVSMQQHWEPADIAISTASRYDILPDERGWALTSSIYR